MHAHSMQSQRGKACFHGEEVAVQVAKMLLIRGLATAAKHRSDDERSAHYEELLEAEQVCRLSNMSGQMTRSLTAWCFVHVHIGFYMTAIL